MWRPGPSPRSDAPPPTSSHSPPRRPPTQTLPPHSHHTVRPYPPRSTLLCSPQRGFPESEFADAGSFQDASVTARLLDPLTAPATGPASVHWPPSIVPQLRRASASHTLQMPAPIRATSPPIESRTRSRLPPRSAATRVAVCPDHTSQADPLESAARAALWVHA